MPSDHFREIRSYQAQIEDRGRPERPDPGAFCIFSIRGQTVPDANPRVYLGRKSPGGEWVPVDVLGGANLSPGVTVDVPAVLILGRWTALRSWTSAPCNEAVNVLAYSVAEWCDEYRYDGEKPDCPEPLSVPGAISGAVVTVVRVGVGGTEIPVIVGHTDAKGRFTFHLDGKSFGTYRVRVRPEGCNRQEQSFTYHAKCGGRTLAFGFCCFGHAVTAIDYDTGAPISGATVDCGNEDACTDQDGTILIANRFPPDVGIIGPCVSRPPCPAPDVAPDDPCDLAIHGAGDGSATGDDRRWTYCSVDAPGYWPEFGVCVPAPCDVPGIVTSKTVKLYSKSKWVLISGGQQNYAGCCPLPPNCSDVVGRKPGMFPTTLYGQMSGPPWLVGDGAPQVLHYARTTQIGNHFFYEWDSGPYYSGAYGCCPHHSDGDRYPPTIDDSFFPPVVVTGNFIGWCRQPNDFDGTCDVVYDGSGNVRRPFLTDPSAVLRGTKIYYGSSRLIFTIQVPDRSRAGTFDEPCRPSLRIQNYWDDEGAGPIGGLGPTCGTSPNGQPLPSLPYWPTSEVECLCGRDPDMTAYLVECLSYSETGYVSLPSLPLASCDTVSLNMTGSKVGGCGGVEELAGSVGE